MASRWTVILSPLAQSRLNAARAVIPTTQLLFNALSLRLAYDPIQDAADIGNGLYALILEPTSFITMKVEVLYLVANGRVLIKNLKFI